MRYLLWFVLCWPATIIHGLLFPSKPDPDWSLCRRLH